MKSITKIITVCTFTAAIIFSEVSAQNSAKLTQSPVEIESSFLTLHHRNMEQTLVALEADNASWNTELSKNSLTGNHFNLILEVEEIDEPTIENWMWTFGNEWLKENKPKEIALEQWMYDTAYWNSGKY